MPPLDIIILSIHRRPPTASRRLTDKHPRLILGEGCRTDHSLGDTFYCENFYLPFFVETLLHCFAQLCSRLQTLRPPKTIRHLFLAKEAAALPGGGPTHRPPGAPAAPSDSLVCEPEGGMWYQEV